MEKYREVERSIIKKYRKEIWSKFVRAIDEYEMIESGDKIAVCVSGGKDSFLLAKCMQELKRHGRIQFDLEFIVMNPGYTDTNLKLIKNNAKELNIPITIFDSNIFSVINTLSHDKPCYLCARMRRGYLYSKAKELGCNKIALGHHYDDVIETIMLSILYGAEFKTMMPKLHSDNFEGMELIRPLYLVREQSIITWKNANNLTFLNCACKFTEGLESNKENLSKRKEIKELIKSFDNISIDNNIFKSAENINMNTVIGYHKGKKRYSFLDNYNNKKFNIKELEKVKEGVKNTLILPIDTNIELNELIVLHDKKDKVNVIVKGIIEYKNINELLREIKQRNIIRNEAIKTLKNKYIDKEILCVKVEYR